jgi:tetratricopeptide (TPR) repeat protein
LEEEPTEWPAQFQKSLLKFKRSVEARYNQATLERLLHAQLVEVRQASILALGMIGNIHANAPLAKCLHDEDPIVRTLTEQALRAVWLRGDSDENNRELQRLMELVANQANAEEILTGFEKLIHKAPRFAEVYNQRAIYHFMRGDYSKAIRDCEKVMRLNAHHFGAATGMGQCFMKQKKLRAALRIYRRANRINPNLEKIRETIVSLERMLGEDKR